MRQKCEQKRVNKERLVRWKTEASLQVGLHWLVCTKMEGWKSLENHERSLATQIISTRCVQRAWRKSLGSPRRVAAGERRVMRTCNLVGRRCGELYHCANPRARNIWSAVDIKVEFCYRRCASILGISVYWIFLFNESFYRFIITWTKYPKRINI